MKGFFILSFPSVIQTFCFSSGYTYTIGSFVKVIKAAVQLQ